jgi:two-component system nitrate/nitrite response regulator NarL
MIANRLGITEATIKVHMKSMLRKINASNRTQAAIWAYSHGYTSNRARVAMTDSGDSGRAGSDGAVDEGRDHLALS